MASRNQQRIESATPPRLIISPKVWVAVFVFVASGYLTLTGLDNPSFWDDEARTAIVAKNFLASGQLTLWDGRNLLAYRRGAGMEPGLKVHYFSLHYPVTALSFRLFGVSTWAARFPFAIAGLATLFVFAMILREEFGTQSWLWVYSLGVLAFSVTFLLHIRQSRYYALSLLFSSFSYYLYRRCLRTRHIGWFILLAISSIALLYSNFLVGGAFLLSLGILHLVFHRSDFSIKDWAKAALAVTIFASATVPYVLINKTWRHGRVPGPYQPWLERKLTLLWWNLREVNVISALPWMILALLALALILHRQRKLTRIALEWATLGIGNVVVLALVSHQPAVTPAIADIRFLVASLPFFAGLQGILLWLVHQWKKPVGILMFVVLACSNLFTLPLFGRDFQWLLPAYIREIHHEYPSSAGAVSEYLAKHARQDDLVYAYPEYFSGPIMFYVGDKVRLCCLLNKKSPLSKEELRELNAPLFNDEHYPDWFVAFGLHRPAEGMLLHFSRPHLKGREIVRFKYRLAERLNIYWDQTQRPELPRHSFGPKTDFDRNQDVYIFKRVED